MRMRILTAGLLAALCGALATAAPVNSRSDMVVHEWGTFLAMNGSDGVSLDGMYHEEHALPAFVHARSRDQLRVRSAIVKGETPVIYFYANRTERVRVTVGFPGGMWTQWYPQAQLVGPHLLAAGAPPRPRNGHISWSVDVIPPAQAHARLPQTQTDVLWNFARDVDASYVRGTDATRKGVPAEWERFIFYRGLGEAPLPLHVRVADDRLAITAGDAGRIEHLYVLRVEDGRAAYSYVPALDAGARITPSVPSLESAVPVEQFVHTIGADLTARLVASGLYEKEARAMVNTWRSSYFGTDGVRVLFVLPQTWTDRYIPLQIAPQPAHLVRVMVGRIEVLTADRERQAEAAVRALASQDAGVRERAFTLLKSEGRYVEPILRRTLNVSTDDRVRVLIRRLLLTDFVTELRTTIADAAGGEKLPHDPVYVRAQLASLLRELGLTNEAGEEAALALAELRRIAPPVMSDHNSRHLFRGLARAYEGAGNDAMALKWYGDFVQFGSQAPKCGGCHAMEGPRDMGFFRDWWAGRKFAEYADRTGQTGALIQLHERNLADRNAANAFRETNDSRRLAAQLALAYLYERQGNTTRAQALWTQLDPASR